MAKKRRPPSPLTSRTVTADRAARLYRLLTLLATGPKTRAALRRSLHLDIRGFYRDLELLRTSSISITLEAGRYSLERSFGLAAARLPFPDPVLTLGEARQLATGRTAAHRKVRKLLEQIQGKPARALPKADAGRR
jgi:predicted DNA-binding transcriptional regulator YafY